MACSIRHSSRVHWLASTSLWESISCTHFASCSSRLSPVFDTWELWECCASSLSKSLPLAPTCLEHSFFEFLVGLPLLFLSILQLLNQLFLKLFKLLSFRLVLIYQFLFLYGPIFVFVFKHTFLLVLVVLNMHHWPLHLVFYLICSLSLDLSLLHLILLLPESLLCQLVLDVINFTPLVLV